MPTNKVGGIPDDSIKVGISNEDSEDISKNVVMEVGNENSKVDKNNKKYTGWRAYIVIIVLFIINMLNYMDRYTVAGVLTQIQAFYNLDDSEAGLLQTVFIVTYMIFAPPAGFLGDRYNRKYILTGGLIIWILAVFASSFIPENYYIAFLLLRGVVGIGEASYATIAPTLIADLFTEEMRSRSLMIFYFATPVGSGLGYIVGSAVASAAGEWQWGIRVTPFFGIVCILLLIFVIEEPERGFAEKDENNAEAFSKNTASYWEDLKYLAHSKTYIFVTLGSTAITFVTGTLSFWAPTAIEYYYAEKNNYTELSDIPSDTKDNISFIFGLITCIGGISGVTIGSLISMWWKNGKYCFPKSLKADAFVCTIASALGVPFLFLIFELISAVMAVTWIMVFITVFLLCVNMAIIVDMTLCIIIPKKRSIANAFQIMISHLFGDASGPYIVGLASDLIRGSDKTPSGHFKSLRFAFYIPNVVLLLSVFVFFFASVYVKKDKERFEREIGLLKNNDDNEKNKKEKIAMKESNSFKNI
uniref:MFS domain-containing protein n=1 Tax=Parastrongyloides trichosuri TaxID=131310 RepID=A0A0N4Z3N5_PARTI